MKITAQLFTQRQLCLFICAIFAITIYGQNSDFQHKKDSLLKVIASTKGEEKLKAYDVLTRLQFPEEELDLMLQYGTDLIKEARKQKNKKYENNACMYQLSYLFNYSKIDEYKRKANEYLPFFKGNGFLESYYLVYSYLLKASSSNNIEYEIEGLNQMCAEAKQENCSYGIVAATSQIGWLYLRENRNEDAEKYFRETIKNALKLTEENPIQILNYDLVLDGYSGLANALINKEGKIDELLSLKSIWREFLTVFEKKFGYPEGIEYYYRLCAFICINKGEYDLAELYCDSAEQRNPLPMILLDYIWEARSEICEARNEYRNAIDWIDKLINNNVNRVIEDAIFLFKKKARILNKMGRAEEAYSVFKMASELNDSIRQLKNNAQLDEIRIQYEVDVHIAEKERQRIIIFSLIGGCILLSIALGIWMYLNWKITKKNHSLAQQVKKMITQQEEQINERLIKTPVSDENDLCIESRMDKLCTAIHDLLLEDKIYRDSTLTRDLVVERLGTNKRAFAEAMEFCFKMQFKDYINFLRMKDAVHLLEHSDLSIEEISDMVGFGTVRTFQIQFNEKYNMTPRDYRNSFKKGQVTRDK